MEIWTQRPLWIISLVIIVTACIPITSRNCPAWDVWVVEEGNQAVSGMTVRLTYQDHSAEHHSHQTDAITDAQGHVAFIARTVTASVGYRAIAVVLSAMEGVHASFGPHATVFVFGKGLEGVAISDQNVVVDWTGEPSHMTSRIVVSPRRL